MATMTETFGSTAIIEKDTPSTTRPWTADFLSRHNLYGYAYHKTQSKDYYPQWKSQLSRNYIIKAELEKIGEDLKRENIDVCLLKGYSLMGAIYQDWGERFASDVDLLIAREQLWRLTDLLKMQGYSKKAEKKWLGNQFKYIFTKKVEEESIVIEVHTQLFWHKPMQVKSNLLESQIEGLKVLDKENQLIHLCGNIGFQHTFDKLFWLVDIYKFVEKYHKQMDWDRFWKVANESRLYKSCYMTLFLCQKLGLNIQLVVYKAPRKSRASIWMLKKLVSLQFLYNPERYPIRNFMVKNLIKDSFWDNLVYWYAWLGRHNT